MTASRALAVLVWYWWFFPAYGRYRPR